MKNHVRYKIMNAIDLYLMPPTHFQRMPVSADVQASLCKQFGNIVVLSWVRPLLLEVNGDIVHPPFHSNILGDVMTLRLATQVLAEWCNIKDKDAWQPFLDHVNDHSHRLREGYRNNYLESYQTTYQPSIDNTTSFLICLLCRRRRHLPSCGHSVCELCCRCLCSDTCPFCDHRMSRRPINVREDVKKKLQNRLNRIKKDFSSADFQFDKVSGNIKQWS